MAEWDYTGISYDVGVQVTIPRGIFFDGSNWYVTGQFGAFIYLGVVYKYDINFNFTDEFYVVNYQDTSPQGIFFDGSNWFILGSSTNRVYKYDINFNYTGFSYYVGDQDTISRGIFFDGNNWWMVGNSTNRVYKYEGPIQTEGKADITSILVYNDTIGMVYEFAPGGPFGDWVPSNPEGRKGDSIRIYVEVTNNGMGDDLKTEIIGDVVGEDIFYLGAGMTHISNFYFTMPNKNSNITINTYHWKSEVVGWVWDNSSVWDVNTWQ